MKTSLKTILLWNPISNHGHLNMYLELYATALLELGYEVHFLAEVDEAFGIYLKNKLPHLSSLDSDFSKRLSKKWTIKWFLTVLLHKIRGGVKYFRKNSSNVEFGVMTRLLKENYKTGFKPDLVICMYLDMTYLERRSRKILRKLNIPWVGLLFHPPELKNKNHFTRNSWFSDYSNRGAIFFTESKIESYKAVSRCDQSFEVFPDVTRKPKEPIFHNSLNIREFANGRPVVGLIGSLDGNKKLIQEFLAASDDSRLKNYCFLMIGEIYESSLSADLLNEIETRKGASRSLYIIDRYIESEEDFDSLFSEIDIIFACYRNFDSSANVLAKSAFFKKPVLVTSGTYIGNLTEQHNLGIAIKNPDVNSIAKSILLLGKELEKQHPNFGFDDYISSVSPEKLENRLDCYLNKLWEL